jgi:hypothetical protein
VQWWFDARLPVGTDVAGLRDAFRAYAGNVGTLLFLPT